MIHYDLLCPGGHAFDGWFRNSAAFETGAADSTLRCPHCDAPGITRALMAPAIGRAAVPAASPTPPAAPPDARAVLPDALRAVLQKVRAEVERTSDYVGPRFAAEARRMHDGAEPTRNIYGEATREEAEGLAADGIEVMRVPWVDRADG